jgi:two-component system, cell cycle sensor histidine kinase and response regulator CckA
LTGDEVNSASKVNILLVDDRSDGLMALEAVLGRPEYNLVSASSGPEALALLDGREYAVILLDVQMPHMNGFETARFIKNRQETRDIPIVFVTAISKEMQYVYQGYESGAVDYLFKPFDPEILRSKVAVFVDLFRKNQKIRQQAEALRESEEQFRLLIEGVQDYSIFMLDPEGRVASWSNAAERMKGYRVEEILGRPFSLFYLEEEAAAGKPAEDLQKAAANGRSESEGWRRHRDGHRFWAHTILTALRHPSGELRGFAKVTRDITERKHAEETLHRKEVELEQTRKLEAVGRLAGGVAHDFNNLITGIMGIAEELQFQLDVRDPRREDLGEIIKASERAFALTRQLLAFGRRQMACPRELNLNGIIQELQKMLVRLIGEDILLTTNLDNALGLIRADPSQLEQVILNLVLNARDAMPQGGRITMTTRRADAQEGSDPFLAGLPPGRYDVLTVEDTGCGMTPEVLSQIFEPFFTTKEKDKGTGLGLSTVYGIVKQSGGEIFVKSQPGQGSCFSIFLPEVAAETQERPPMEVVSEKSFGHETILVVEDEDIVRHVTSGLLRKRGYRVLEARDGPQALEVTRKHPEPIHLLLTDVVLPGMNGRAVATALAERHPSIRILYISRYTEDIIAHKGILEPGIHFLDKSLLTHQLADKVRQLLDQDPPPPVRVSKAYAS